MIREKGRLRKRVREREREEERKREDKPFTLRLSQNTHVDHPIHIQCPVHIQVIEAHNIHAYAYMHSLYLGNRVRT